MSPAFMLVSASAGTTAAETGTSASFSVRFWAVITISSRVAPDVALITTSAADQQLAEAVNMPAASSSLFLYVIVSPIVIQRYHVVVHLAAMICHSKDPCTAWQAVVSRPQHGAVMRRR